VRRRKFIALLGGAVASAWPRAGWAQTARVIRIGFLGAASASGYIKQVEGFRIGLRELGYSEGTNIIILYRWAEGDYDRLPQLAAELVRSNVEVIVTHGTPATLAVKQATTSIPIVVATLGDPAASGVITSVGRPGGNITGQSMFGPEINAKRIELLKEMMPRLSRVAVLLNPDNPSSVGPELRAMELAGQTLKIELQQFPIRGAHELGSVFDKIERAHAEAVEVSDDGVFNANIKTIAELSLKRRLLSIGSKELAQVGGLIGYGVDFVAMFRRAAVFVDKILKGNKPADIPFEQATKFQFVLNLATAKTLGLDVPTSLLLRADEVIE
jgi:putative tryptophan/tyrosine transport system substrate-binding protein